MDKRLRPSSSRTRRGATGTAYALVLGLVSILAILAVTSTGSNVTRLLGGVGVALDSNAAPVMATNMGVAVQAGAPNAAITSSQLQVTDAEQSPQNLSLTLSETTTSGTLFLDRDGNGAVSTGEELQAGDSFTQADIDDGLLRYAHTGNATGNDGFVVTLSDGNKQTGPYTVTIAIGNQPPTLSGVAIAGLIEDTLYNFTQTDFGFIDPDNTVLEPASVTIHSFTGSGTLNHNSSTATLPLTLTAAQVSDLSYMPPMDASGVTDTLVVSASDGFADSPQTSFDLSVEAVNDPPVLTGLSGASIQENNSIGDLIGTLSATDAENGTLTYSLASGGDNDSFRISGDRLEADVAFDYESRTSYSISVTVTDDGSPAESDSQNFTISIGNEADTTFFTGWTYGPCVQYVNGSTAQFCSSVSNPSCPSGSSQVGSVDCQWHQWCGQFWTNQFRKRVQCAN